MDIQQLKALASVLRAANELDSVFGSGVTDTAGDTSIVVGGTSMMPTIETGTLDVIATDHPPAANWSNNSHKITSLANGSAAQDAAAFGQIPTSASSIGGALTANNLSDLASESTAFANLSPLTAKGDLIIENGTPAPARLAVGSAGQVLGVASGMPAWGMGLTLLATTGAGGFALQNGTPTILTWTAPNDGLLHRVLPIGELIVTSDETGGAITMNYTDPAGNARSPQLEATSQTIGQPAFSFSGRIVQANTVVTITQAPLSSGAATLYMELWGS